ncbi:MAG: YrzE family protein [Clostridiales bacterium]|nr:YrzE family protein [Clostridiales bacterium]
MKTRTHRTERTLPKAFRTGLAVAFIVELVLLSVMAALTSAGVIAESAMPVFSVICALLSSFAGSFTGAVRAPKLSLPSAMGVGTAAFAINFALGLMLPGSEGFSASMPAAFMGGAVLAGILSAVKKGRK